MRAAANIRCIATEKSVGSIIISGGATGRTGRIGTPMTRMILILMMIRESMLNGAPLCDIKKRDKIKKGGVNMNRRICAFAAMMFFALCMALGCFETCFATDDTNEYSIKSADFDIRMNEDGSAKVTEKWKVKYETGTATSFCKDIYKISKGNESFGIVYGFSVKIDGKRCKEGETNKKDDNTYTVENNSHTITISCFKSSSEVERTYEISYVFKNVVKTDGKDWYLIYRVIGENFKKEVWNITVRIYAPAGKRCTEECIYKSYGKSSNPSDRCVKIKCDSNTGILKVGAKISGENVFDLKYENTLYNKDEIRDNDSHINIDKDKDSHINNRYRYHYRYHYLFYHYNHF